MSSGTRAAPVALACGILTIAIGQAALVLGADDVVYLKPRTDGVRGQMLSGKIVDYTGRELKLQSATGRERTIPADRIEHVATTYCDEQRSGDALAAKHDFRGALEQYRRALAGSREPREWVRRQILTQIVWCLRNLGQDDQAGEFFLVLLASDPYTRSFDCMPLAWTLDAPPAATARKARGWLDSKNPAAELLGASHLLATEARPAAVEHLKRLLFDPDPRIAWLAQAQLWRIRAPAAPREQLQEWMGATEAADPALRAGAYFVLGSALVPTAPEEAALALLKVPILYEREDRLAASALLAAGECLERTRRARQAAALYRELAESHPQAPEAREAGRRLQSLASSEPARDN